MSTASSHRAGSTLVEVVVSTLLVGVVLAAAFDTLGGATRTYRAAASRADGGAIADALLAEIAAQAYREPNSTSNTLGPGATGESQSPDRLTLDDVDDYTGLVESPPVDRSGLPVPGYGGWERRTTVQYVNRARDSSGELATRSTTEGLKRIEVTVTDPEGRQTTVYALRSERGPAEVPPAATGVVVRGLAATVEASGSPARTLATPCVNESRAP